MKNNYIPNKITAEDSFIENGVYDPNNILNHLTKDTGYVLKSISEGTYINPLKLHKLDGIDLSNLNSWYKKYKIVSSYPESKNNILSEDDINLISEVKSMKGKLDLMNLVEIAIGGLIEKSLEDSGFYVRIRKTSNFDDIKSGIDYIVEYLDKKRNVKKVVGIDLTITGDNHILDRKKRRKTSKPIDYLDYIKSKKGLEIKNNIPRLVLNIDRDFAFSMTNNYFIGVIEKGDLLDSKDISDIVDFAIEDLKIKLNTSANTFGFSRNISHLIEKTQNLTNKYLNYKK